MIQVGMKLEGKGPLEYYRPKRGRPVKKYLLTLFVLMVPSILFGNPFVGKWKMDLVAAANPYILEFVDDTTF